MVAERAPLARMPALIIVVYAAAVYLLFLAVLGYAVGFFAGFGVPKGIDQGPRRRAGRGSHRPAVATPAHSPGWDAEVTLCMALEDLWI